MPMDGTIVPSIVQGEGTDRRGFEKRNGDMGAVGIEGTEGL